MPDKPTYEELEQRVLELEKSDLKRKKAEDALRESEERFRRFFMNAPLPYQSLDENGNFIEVNSTFLEILGYSIDEVIGKNFGDFLHPDYVAHFKENFPRFKAVGEVLGVEFEMVKKDGSIVLVSFNGKIQRDDQSRFLRTHCIFQDITERKIAESNLQATLNRFYMILTNMPAGVLLVSEDDRIEFCNQAFCNMFNLEESPEDLWGLTSDEMFERVKTIYSNPEQAVGRIMEIVARMELVKDENVSMRSGLTVLRDFVPLRLNGLKFSRLWIYKDITARKRAEEQLRALLSEKEVLLKEVHHRVKNNLQIISSLISLQSDNLTDETIQGVLSDAGTRIRTIALVHEMLYRSNNLAQLDFAVYAADLLQCLWGTGIANYKKVSLHLSLAPLPLPINLAVNCGLILNELATNALKHAFPNDTAGDVSVALEHDSATGDVCLIVSDNGIGLPVDFDWRQSSSLGLDIVQMLAGQIRASVQTGPGPGTEFRIKFNIDGIPS